MSPVVALFDPAKNRRQRRAATLGRQRPAKATPAAAARPHAGAAVAANSPTMNHVHAAPPAAFERPGLTSEHAVLLELFGRAPVAYHRSFVDIAGGSVTAALWLSHALELSQRLGQPEVILPQDECLDATGLTRREQETARSRLREAGLLSESRRGRQLVFRLDLTAIAGRLLAHCSGAWAASSSATGTDGH